MATGDGWIYPSWHNGGEGGDMVGFDVTVDMASDDAKIHYFSINVRFGKHVFIQNV